MASSIKDISTRKSCQIVVLAEQSKNRSRVPKHEPDNDRDHHGRPEALPEGAAKVPDAMGHPAALACHHWRRCSDHAHAENDCGHDQTGAERGGGELGGPEPANHHDIRRPQLASRIDLSGSVARQDAGWRGAPRTTEGQISQQSTAGSKRSLLQPTPDDLVPGLGDGEHGGQEHRCDQEYGREVAVGCLQSEDG